MGGLRTKNDHWSRKFHLACHCPRVKEGPGRQQWRAWKPVLTSQKVQLTGGEAQAREFIEKDSSVISSQGQISSIDSNHGVLAQSLRSAGRSVCEALVFLDYCRRIPTARFAIHSSIPSIGVMRTQAAKEVQGRCYTWTNLSMGMLPTRPQLLKDTLPQLRGT